MPAPYVRPVERPFTAAERDHTTILFGGLTDRHERLFQAALEGCGYRAQRLPTPDFDAMQLGREFANAGQCNPVYFTLGSLIRFLRALEAEGMSRQAIIDAYVFFTAGSCGPCRFGMYESEYRLALGNAGFEGFRVLLFQQDHGLKQKGGAAGLQYSVDFGLRTLLAILAADLFNDLAYQIRPYEVRAGETDRVMAECVSIVAARLADQEPFDIGTSAPRLASFARWPRLAPIARRLALFRHRMHGAWIGAPLDACRERIASIEVDRLRVKPVVKITGEFWAQTTEGDGNYRMFEVLGREGAEVFAEPVGSWVTYLTSHARLAARRRFRNETHDRRQRLTRRERFRQWKSHWGRVLLLRIGEGLYEYYHGRTVRRLGGAGRDLAPQDDVARLAAPFYNPLARGGEGHLEVGKTIYYTLYRRCHMVLSLKPFGCMPSAQSDGVQSAVGSRYPEILFVPIETSGDAEINALSRVQMALSDARRRARDEYDRALASTGRTLGEIVAHVDSHPALRRAGYRVPRRPGIAGTAANFVLHVGALLGPRAAAGRIP